MDAGARLENERAGNGPASSNLALTEKMYLIVMPCKDIAARRRYNREWIAKRRAAWFAINGPCVQCKSLVDLRLDHIDPKQKVDHKIWSWSEERRNAELSKCQVLCEPCHKIKTAKDKWDASPHGTQSKYTCGCRCQLCLDAHNLSTREWRYSKGLRKRRG